MSYIDISNDEIRTASDNTLREWVEGMRHSGYPEIANEIIGRIIDEQLRRTKGGKT